jgi:D-sedoheptulose 7-phosphate isomerase
MEHSLFINHYLKEICRIANTLSGSDIERVIDILFEAWSQNKQVFICGNGGSASTATHFACDLAKTVGSEGKRPFRAECLNDNVPLVLALVNDNGFDNIFSEQLKTKFCQGDVVICLSAHGGAGKDRAGTWSQNLLKAMLYARENKGKSIGFSGFDGGPMKEIADACIVVPAHSTPLVESFHLVLEHLVIFRLKEMIFYS